MKNKYKVIGLIISLIVIIILTPYTLNDNPVISIPSGIINSTCLDCDRVIDKRLTEGIFITLLTIGLFIIIFLLYSFILYKVKSKNKHNLE